MTKPKEPSSHCSTVSRDPLVAEGASAQHNETATAQERALAPEQPGVEPNARRDDSGGEPSIGHSDQAQECEGVEGPDLAQRPELLAERADDSETREVVRAHLKGLVEALVFASDTPLSPAEIAKAAKGDRKLVRELLSEIARETATRGVQLVEVAGGYAFRTSAAYAPFVRDLAARRPVRLTRAQLETLAIVAYRQPLTRPEIDDIRGVDSGPVLKMLLERDLVRIIGKRDEPGRPLVYGTTSTFLDFFNLKSLKDLPTLKEFTELTDDSRRSYEREMGDSVPEAASEDRPAQGSAEPERDDLDLGAEATADVAERPISGAGDELRDDRAEQAERDSGHGSIDPGDDGQR